MLRDQAIGKFREGSRARDVPIEPERPAFARRICQRTKDRFRAARYGPIRLDQVDGLFERLSFDFGKVLGDFETLKRGVIYLIAGRMSPANNPAAAEITVAIEQHQWFLRRRLNTNPGGHAVVLPQPSLA